MDPKKQRYYIDMAMNNPNILCRDVPAEILAETAYDDIEPSKFFKEYLETGYTHWHQAKIGYAPTSEKLIKYAIIVLWSRACRMYINSAVGHTDPDEDKSFFSDEGLYE